MKPIHNFATLLLFFALATAAGAAPEDVVIQEPGNLTRDRYEIKGRLWVDSWRSAFEVPRFAERAAAIADLKAEAARLGANALTNVSCLVDSSPLWGGDPHFCYALAIRVK